MSDSVAPALEAIGRLGLKCATAGAALAILASSRYSPVATAILVVATALFVGCLIRTFREELGKLILACVERVRCRP